MEILTHLRGDVKQEKQGQQERRASEARITKHPGRESENITTSTVKLEPVTVPEITHFRICPTSILDLDFRDTVATPLEPQESSVL